MKKTSAITNSYRSWPWLKLSTVSVSVTIALLLVATFTDNTVSDASEGNIARISAIAILTSLITIASSVTSIVTVRSWRKLLPAIYILASMGAILVSWFYIAWFGL